MYRILCQVCGCRFAQSAYGNAVHTHHCKPPFCQSVYVVENGYQCPECNTEFDFECGVVFLEHKKLKRSDESPYRSECPFCDDGVFLIRRDEKTFELLELDNCISCGQHVVYKDIEDLRKEEKSGSKDT
jgi:hypothetical protein